AQLDARDEVDKPTGHRRDDDGLCDGSSRQQRGKAPSGGRLSGWCHPSMISTDSMTMGSCGRSIAPVGAASIASTTFFESSSTTSPKIVCLPLSHGVGTVEMKNCEPFVPLPPR